MLLVEDLGDIMTKSVLDHDLRGSRSGMGFDTHEPQWILEDTGTGISFWRRKTEGRDRIRVRFLQEVKIIECERIERENTGEWNSRSIVAVALTFLFCLAIGVVLPWYLVVGR